MDNDSTTPRRIDTLGLGSPEEVAGPAEGPLASQQRLSTLDFLRGVALLGILLLNIEDFAGSEGLWDIPVGLPMPAFIGWHKGVDYTLLAVNWIFAEGRMRSMFAMLFGAGVVLLTDRLQRRSDPGRVATIYYRRNLWLLLFGFLDGFVLWYGDILVDYSTCALVFLYPLRRLTARALLILGLIIWLIGGTFGSTRAFDVTKIIRSNAALQIAKAAGTFATAQQRDLIRANAEEQETRTADIRTNINDHRLGFIAGWPSRITAELSILKLKFASLWILEWLGAMITGMGLFKSGYLTNKRPRADYLRLALFGYAISIPLATVGLVKVHAAGFSPVAFATWMGIPYTTEVLTGTLANVSLLLLIVRGGRLGDATVPFIAVGRTAFSNYILTTLLCQWFFCWGPWKIYDRLQYYQWYIVVVAIWSINIVASVLWLRIFAFGPLEWFWRSLTYWKRQPLRLSVQGGSKEN